MNLMAYNFDAFYRRWALLSSGVQLLGLALAIRYSSIYYLLICTLLLFGYFTSHMRRFLPEWPAVIGYANWVSIARLVIVLIFLAGHQVLPGEYIFAGLFFAICLDGLDGYAARRFQHVSAAGGALDMEIDAMMVLALSWLQVEEGVVSPWILISGSLRYTYELLFFWLPAKDVDFPPKIVRATIAIGFLLALLTPFVLSQSLSQLMIEVMGVLILGSFGSALVARFFQGRISDT